MLGREFIDDPPPGFHKTVSTASYRVEQEWNVDYNVVLNIFFAFTFFYQLESLIQIQGERLTSGILL